MIKIKLTIISLLFLFSTTYGQIEDNIDNNIRTKNAVYLELFGNAVYLYNFSYDRIIFTKEKNNFSLGLGIQYFPDSNFPNDYILSVSPQVNYFYGVKHHFETGLGVTFIINDGALVIPIRIGYRFQEPNGGLFFKMGFTPLYIYDYFGNPAFIPWGGLSIGWNF